MFCFTAGRCQVTSMAALNGELFIGTTWGCIIIAEGKTMRPITIFRPFEEDVKIILPLPGSKKPMKSVNNSPRNSPVRTPTRVLSPTASQNASRPPVIATIGKGYRNLIGRFTNIQTSPVTTNDKGLNKKGITALLWRAEHWVGN